MYSLQINGNKVDLNNNFSVNLSYNAIDLLNPVTRTAAFTYSISIPKTASNNQLFNYIAEDCVIDKFKVNEFPCILSYNTQQIIKGIFYLDEITDSYIGQIVSDNLDWLKNFNSNDKVKTLSGFTMPFPYINDLTSTFRTIQDMESKTSLDNDINFPFITRGNYNSFFYNQDRTDIMSLETTVDINSAYTYFNCLDIIPSYYYVNSIQNIFSYYGLSVECNIFKENRELLVPFTSSKQFEWNWGRIGRASAVYSGSSYVFTETYFNNFKQYNVLVDRSFLESKYGFEYLVLEDGNMTINLSSRTGFSSVDIFISRANIKDTEYTVLASNVTGTSSGSTVTYTGDFKVGDRIFVYGGSIPFNNKPIQAVEIHYNNKDVELNYQQILPDITPLEYIKNFLNLYGLYPYYNEYTKTVYLLTLDEFILNDTFTINSINNKSIKDYTTIKSLKYTIDDKDPLLIDNEYDYIGSRGQDVTLLFSPSKRRDFTISNFNGSSYSGVTTSLLSITSQDQIDLDRLSFSVADIVDYLPWSPVSSYTKGDQVTYNTRYFTSLVDDNSGYTPSDNNIWDLSFVGDYNTSTDYDFVTRIISEKHQAVYITSYTGNYITSDKVEKLFYLDCEFDINLNTIYNDFYKRYTSLINNRTSVLIGQGYIPRHKFSNWLNRPVEVTYNSDKYIILGITEYNPETEFGKISLIKKITYTDYI